MGSKRHEPGLDHNPDWLREAIICEIHIRPYRDSNGAASETFQG